MGERLVRLQHPPGGEGAAEVAYPAVHGTCCGDAPKVGTADGLLTPSRVGATPTVILLGLDT